MTNPYAEGNSILDNSVSDTFNIPFYSEYRTKAWIPTGRPFEIVAQILSFDDRQYSEHRLKFFRWAIYAQIEKCRKYSKEYVTPLISEKGLLKKELQRLSSEAASILPTIIHKSSHTLQTSVYDNKSKEIIERMKRCREKLAVREAHLKEMWKEEVVFEEVYWYLRKQLYPEEFN